MQQITAYGRDCFRWAGLSYYLCVREHIFRLSLRRFDGTQVYESCKYAHVRADLLCFETGPETENSNHVAENCGTRMPQKPQHLDGVYIHM